MSKFYVDTSVFVAGMAGSHVHHEVALPWLEAFSTGKRKGAVSHHVLAEFCATITHSRYDFSVSAAKCSGLIEDGILEVCETAHLSLSQYKSAISRLARYDGRNGQFYDCLHIEAALAAKCDSLVTLNFRDFSRFGRDSGLHIVDAASKKP